MDYLLIFTLLLITALFAIISVYIGYRTWSKNRKFEKSLEEHRKYLKMEKELDTSELVKKAYALINRDNN